jgi:hypothetical protein
MRAKTPQALECGILSLFFAGFLPPKKPRLHRHRNSFSAVKKQTTSQPVMIAS